MYFYIDTINEHSALDDPSKGQGFCHRVRKPSCSTMFSSMVAWPNGKALDYESRDSRFDPWRDHSFACLCEEMETSFGLLGEFFFGRLGEAQTSLSVALTAEVLPASPAPPGNHQSLCIPIF